MIFKSFAASAAMVLAFGGAIAQTPPAETVPAQTVPAETPPAAPPAQPISRPAPTYASAVPPAQSGENIWHLDLSSGGRVSIQLRPDAAPHHVERIRTLTRQGFYNGLIFHRVVEGFMAQGGDPQGTGLGGSPLPDLEPEFTTLPHVRGTVAMARSQSFDSANSQFYIMFGPGLSLDYNYTVFGRVIGGMGFVDAIQRGVPAANPTRIVRASIGADNVPPPSAAELSAAAAPAPVPAAPTTMSVLPPPR
jgi:cyclophilin family peptidyl-prolyl cis-trans isomerase